MDKKNISMDEFHELYRLKQNYVSVANSYVQGWELAEDIVADSYMFLWENIGELEIENPKSYLLGVIRHKCLDALRHRETTKKVQEQMDRMPRLTSSVFAESRINGRTHSEISSKLGIPVRTVTYEISKAIKILRKSLGEYLILLVALCLFKNHSHLS